MKALNAHRQVKAAGGARLVIPKDGWNSQSFVAHGAALIATQYRVARLVQRKAGVLVAKAMKKYLDDQLESVIRNALAQHGVKAVAEFRIPQNERLWLNAIDEVLKESKIEVELRLVPTLQSVAAQGYSRTNILLNQTDTQAAARRLAREAQDIAEHVVSINDTTRERIVRRVRDSISDGETVTETAQKLRREVPPINSGRALTIARTETSNAYTEGIAEAFRQSETLSHVSVIGCEAREPNSPKFDGESTCNFADLEIERLDEFLAVGFHPNHTGVLVPSGFKD